MSPDLLTSVLEAHGGLDAWRRFTRVEATIVSGGLLFEGKGLQPDPTPRRMTAALHHEWASVHPFGADGIKMPTKRRAYLRGEDGRPLFDQLMVWIDLSDYRFS